MGVRVVGRARKICYKIEDTKDPANPYVPCDDWMTANYSEMRLSMHTKTEYDDGIRNRSPAEEEPDYAAVL